MALLKDGTRIYGTLYANTEVVIGSLNVSSQIATAFDKANSAGIAANTPSSVANAAYNHANAAFIAANTGTGATGAYNAANAAFIVANSAAIAANTPSTVANAAFIRANNSINANTGGTITGNLVVVGNIVASIISTGGDSGDITGANNIYANTLYAKNIDVLTYINAAFNAANAGGGGSSTDQFARNTGNAAFIHANAAFNAANAGGSSTDQFARDTANSKSYIFYQNTAPVTSNSNDIWIDTDNGAAYENFGTSASPVWAEMGPSNSIANTPPGTLALTTLNITSHISFTGNQRQTVPYQGYGIDNVARDTANSTAIRANNSLNANNGGTVTSNVVVVGNVHANLFITTGSGGDISNANTVYSNSVSTGNVTVSTLVTAANVIVNNNITVKSNTTVLGNVSVAGELFVTGGAPWLSYTPSWTSSGTAPALGNGTITGKYKQIGKTVFVRVHLSLGSTSTTGTGNWRFTLPIAASSSDGVVMPATFLDNGVNWYTGTVTCAYDGSTSYVVPLTSASPSTAVTTAVPFTWATADALTFNGSYEAA
jgi:hypothetical protein